ncbi:adenylate/guanylate cyclase domain-containing protein [Labrys miyagiensis]|uniref:Adenylate/guanylate cyclase domain-containing protein n=1 Tax=Labrys miyagiensis TaxID=346912 RepID=A0ABQ6CER4_9HYPH|nr:adenylate/guanylate cyclase domain-containing protein [Labrys miyagiensis]GLS18390.1 adenylate/guanylate cyclase domain-containing protein [Labrys miyagiensis]
MNSSLDGYQCWDVAGERRQLTVMFSDIVQFTQLAGRQDPETVGQILEEYRTVAIAAIERFGGTLSDLSGDGILAKFGFPLALENSAESAVRAGLAVIEDIRSLAIDLRRQYGEGVEIRVGIYTGIVVVSDRRLAGTNVFSSVVGEAVNVAARLQALAAPNSTVVGDTTRALLKDAFDLEPLGNLTLKGMSRPIDAYSVVSERRWVTEKRSNPASQKDLFTARSSELSTLMGLWNGIPTQGGCLTIVEGEAGIGKSRLLREFERVLGVTADLRLLASSHYQNTAFHPLLRLLKERLDFATSPDGLVNAKSLEGLIGPDCGEETAQLLEEISGLKLATGSAVQGRLFGPERRLALKKILLSVLAGQEQTGRRLVIVEDAQWLDPSTIELLENLASTFPTRQLLLVITTRSALQSAPLQHLGHILSLKRLAPAAALGLIHDLVGPQAMPPDIAASIAERSDGIPLFIEEVTRSYLETGITQQQAQPAGKLASEKETVPATLRDSLMVRLDRLGSAKRVAQLAAVYGRTFPLAVIAKLSGLGSDEFDGVINTLLQSGIIEESSVPEKQAFLAFRHALIRDAAYESLLKSQRLVIHRVLAQILVTEFRQLSEEEPERIANHWRHAGDFPQAADFGMRAARLSVSRSANQEALRQIGLVLELLPRIDDTFGRHKLEFEACLVKIAPVIATGGYGSPEVATLTSHALSLLDRHGKELLHNGNEPFLLYYSEWSHLQVTGRIREAAALSHSFLQRVEASHSEHGLIIAHRLVGTSHLLGGNLQQAEAHLVAALALYDRTRPRHLAYLYGTDFGIMSECHLALTLWLEGRADEAMRMGEKAYHAALAFDHANTQGYAFTHLCMLRVLTEDVKGLELLVQQLRHLATSRQLPFWGVIATGFSGWQCLQQGQVQKGMDLLTGGLLPLRQMNLVYWCPTYLAWMAEGHMLAGDLQAADAAIEEALRIIATGGEVWFKSECWRVKAVLLQRRGLPPAVTLLAALKSVRMAWENQSPTFMLRSTTELLRLALDLRRTRVAHLAMRLVTSTIELLSALEPLSANVTEARHQRHRGATPG